MQARQLHSIAKCSGPRFFLYRCQSQNAAVLIPFFFKSIQKEKNFLIEIIFLNIYHRRMQYFFTEALYPVLRRSISKSQSFQMEDLFALVSHLQKVVVSLNITPVCFFW